MGVTSPSVDDSSPDIDDVWVYDMASRTPMRLTTTGRERHPTWTPDGDTSGMGECCNPFGRQR